MLRARYKMETWGRTGSRSYSICYKDYKDYENYKDQPQPLNCFSLLNTSTKTDIDIQHSIH